MQDVAYFLNVSESTVRNLERDRVLPALPRIGTRIIFDPQVVRAFRDGWRPAEGERGRATFAKHPAHPGSNRTRR
ncbi:MAG: helix-turn-helix domain-containing protein [Anaeromyxobacteraceae bacterium]|nr:helix-turn-helix domain-containing protein [Anaeromyxobacteraceae bacterium]